MPWPDDSSVEYFDEAGVDGDASTGWDIGGSSLAVSATGRLLYRKLAGAPLSPVRPPGSACPAAASDVR
jgi:hypothetical protein